MKIDSKILNIFGVFIYFMAIVNIIAAYYIEGFDKFLVWTYSIGLVIIYFIVINCDMQWKKKE